MKVNSTNSKDPQELTKTNTTTVDKECLSPCDSSFKDLLKQTQETSTNNISVENTSMTSDINDLKSLFTYDTFTMDKNDAKFFIDMIGNGQFSLNLQGDINASVMQLNVTDSVQQTYKSADVSKTLVNLIENAYNNQKPVRIDFDNNVAVILKVDKQGKVSAEFIPGDKAVEQYLKDNIAFLKQRFDDEELEYNQLSYRQYKDQKQKQNNENNENNDNKGE